MLMAHNKQVYDFAIHAQCLIFTYYILSLLMVQNTSYYFALFVKQATNLISNLNNVSI